jgi:hypothetical protein
MEHDSGVSTVRAWWPLAGALLLAGCSTTAGTGTGAVAPTPAPASGVPSVGPSPHMLGQKVDTDHSFVEATVYSYEQPVAAGAPAPNPGDYTWAAADVQACAAASNIFNASANTLNWQVVYADQTEVDATRVTYPQFPRPLFPMGQRRLKPGECVRGWIVFGVPVGAKPVVVRFAPFGAPPVDWVAAPAG